MSEREIRHWLEECRGTFKVLGQEGFWWDELELLTREALDTDPDPVAVLQRWREEAKDDMLMAAVQDRLEDIVLDEAGLRLTDDGGWEWVEEGSDAE